MLLGLFGFNFPVRAALGFVGEGGAPENRRNKKHIYIYIDTYVLCMYMKDLRGRVQRWCMMVLIFLAAHLGQGTFCHKDGGNRSRLDYRRSSLARLVGQALTYDAATFKRRRSGNACHANKRKGTQRKRV